MLKHQALRDIDSAHDTRLGSDSVEAQAFLQGLDEATRDNHAIFGQYANTSPAVQSALDAAYKSVYKPRDGQTIAGLNGSNAGALTGSDLALNDAARDYASMRQQPQETFPVSQKYRQKMHLPKIFDHSKGKTKLLRLWPNTDLMCRGFRTTKVEQRQGSRIS